MVTNSVKSSTDTSDQTTNVQTSESTIIYADKQIHVRPYNSTTDLHTLQQITKHTFNKQRRTILLYAFQSKISSIIRIITLILLYIKLTFYNDTHGYNVNFSYLKLLNPFTQLVLIAALLSTITAISLSLYKHNQYTQQSITDLNKYSHSTDSSLLVVCNVDNNNIIGCIAIQQINSHTIQIKRVLVVPQHQRHGIGSKLLHIIQHYIEVNMPDVYHLYVETTNDNIAAKKLYHNNEYALYRTVGVAGSWYTNIYVSQYHKMLPTQLKYTIYKDAKNEKDVLTRSFLPVDEIECRTLFYQGMVPNVAQLRGAVLFSNYNKWFLTVYTIAAAIFYHYIQPRIYIFVGVILVSFIISQCIIIMLTTYMFEQIVDEWATIDMTDIAQYYNIQQRKQFIVAVVNNAVVGCVGLDTTNQPDTCELKRMYVSNTHKRQGIATQLLHTFDTVAKQLNYKTVQCSTAYIPAMFLYEKHGFKEYNEIVMNSGTVIKQYRKSLVS